MNDESVGGNSFEESGGLRIRSDIELFFKSPAEFLILTNGLDFFPGSCINAHEFTMSGLIERIQENASSGIIDDGFPVGAGFVIINQFIQSQ